MIRLTTTTTREKAINTCFAFIRFTAAILSLTIYTAFFPDYSLLLVAPAEWHPLKVSSRCFVRHQGLIATGCVAQGDTLTILCDGQCRLLLFDHSSRGRHTHEARQSQADHTTFFHIYYFVQRTVFEGVAIPSEAKCF